MGCYNNSVLPIPSPKLNLTEQTAEISENIKNFAHVKLPFWQPETENLVVPKQLLVAVDVRAYEVVKAWYSSMCQCTPSAIITAHFVSFCLCAQSMRWRFTMQRSLSLARRIHMRFLWGRLPHNPHSKNSVFIYALMTVIYSTLVQKHSMISSTISAIFQEFLVNCNQSFTPMCTGYANAAQCGVIL